jgi:crotonobetainyl-CoA:carnitine CoA-transferase CaiB-like acyl-CoA transferase
MLTILEHERYLPVLCRILGIEKAADDPRFNNGKALVNFENKKALIELIENRFATKNADEWMKLLKENDIVHDRLKHFKEVSESEQAIANDYMSEVEFLNGKKTMMPRPAIQSYNLGLPEYKRGPWLGEDTNEILKGLGYDDEKIRLMIDSDIVKSRD